MKCRWLRRDSSKASSPSRQQRLAVKAKASCEFRFVPIRRDLQGNEHIVTVGTYGSFAGHLVAGGDGTPPIITNPPLADPTHKSFSQGEATRLDYRDAGQDWKYHNSNYMFNHFKVDNQQYAKFEAEMARKMAGK